MLIQNGEFPGNSVKLPVRLIEKGRKSMSRDLPDNTKKIIRKVDRICLLYTSRCVRETEFHFIRLDLMAWIFGVATQINV